MIEDAGHSRVATQRRMGLLYVVILAMILAMSPVRLDLSSKGGLELKVHQAFAKSGSGKNGDDDDEDDEDDDDEDDDDEDDDEDDEDDDDDDDDDDDGDEDDEEDEDGEVGVSSVEASRSGVRILYSDGSRETIQKGVYERLDADGRRLERRTADGADIARLKALATRASPQSVTRRDPSGNDTQRVRSSGNSIRVTHSNGWVEEISQGVYRLIDPFARSVATRPATRADQRRLKRLANRR